MELFLPFRLHFADWRASIEVHSVVTLPLSSDFPWRQRDNVQLTTALLYVPRHTRVCVTKDQGQHCTRVSQMCSASQPLVLLSFKKTKALIIDFRRHCDDHASLIVRGQEVERLTSFKIHVMTILKIFYHKSQLYDCTYFCH